MNHVIALDIGTTHLKATLFSPAGVGLKRLSEHTPYVCSGK
jgi:predicted NBD/HSP70 family sugar kinase